MELYLIRHPRPDVAPGTCYGQTDLGLAESPRVVAERLRPLLPADYALYTSPLRRARLLAEALGSPQVDARLQEIHFGEWEGRSFDEIGKAALDAWSAAPLDFAPPGGESPRQMAACAKPTPPPPWWSPMAVPCEPWPGSSSACRRKTGWVWISPVVR